MQHESVHSQQPLPSQDDIDAVMARAIAPMQEYAEKPGIGGKNRRLSEERVKNIAQVVLDSPDRVAYDQSAPVATRLQEKIVPGAHLGTEYDVEKAHFEAIAVKPFMDSLAEEKKRAVPNKNKVTRLEMAAANAMVNAEEAYDEHPLEAAAIEAQILARDLRVARQKDGTLNAGVFGIGADVKPVKIDSPNAHR